MIELKVIFHREDFEGRDPIYTAVYEAMPSCSFSAESKEEARAGLERIRVPYIESRRARGLPIPGEATSASGKPNFWDLTSENLLRRILESRSSVSPSKSPSISIKVA